MPPEQPQPPPHPFRPPPPPSRLLSVQSVATKRSLLSHSSFEADDERSTTTDSDRMSPRDSLEGDGHGPPHPGHSYPGEDTRPTSKKELAGWYMYAFAAETYVICAISSFIPILLESLARENGVLLSDRTTPCGDSSKPGIGPSDQGQCIVSLLGVDINTASFAMYTFSISVLLQAVVVVTISCAADHGNYRKRLLLLFAWIGSACVMAYIFVTKEVYLLGALLAIISNTAFGASFVLLNSFLPLLVRHHPQVRASAVKISAANVPGLQITAHSPRQSFSQPESGLVNSTSNLLPQDASEMYELQRAPTHEELTSIELQLSTRISAQGIGIGYGAALFVQCVSIVMLVALGSSTWSQRVVLFFIGSWWAAFTAPAALWLRPRPGPPLADTGKKGARAALTYAVYSWKNLFRTIKLAGRLKDILLFLAAWFLLSDAVATTSGTAVLFAKTHLKMTPGALGLINVISTSTGVVGAFSWSFIARHFKLRPHQVLLSIIAVFELIPLYGLLGYLPFVQRWQVIGLQQPWEMYPLAAVYGFVLGGLGAYCRSLYGELIPPGSEAAFYALYAITDKGSSVFGPTIVGAIIDASGEIRPAFWFLLALVGLPAPFIYFVDVERGKKDGEKLSEVIEAYKQRGEDGVSTPHYEDGERQGMLADYDGTVAEDHSQR
ncbi:autophagy-related protein 22-like protein [Microdochium trichocladiopsis]|uniref:Autophagy-related protein n=1 Tax=Microdochium trichocladiopsis TaxID=1682393 RepID=A0A9P9BN53_9PEZI|nr:autophagy-related protein 22-like protein [Microdochium trichocladiopsis]KAH7027368.1 autophagy-related protein 22-like protein [Microdochium trichocladiopsis]